VKQQVVMLWNPSGSEKLLKEQTKWKLIRPERRDRQAF
jgi:hypothetical protein